MAEQLTLDQITARASEIADVLVAEAVCPDSEKDRLWHRVSRQAFRAIIERQGVVTTPCHGV